jgi:hypothetical protein
MHLEDALTQIREIRGQLARTEIYRGTRAATLAATAVLAGVAAILQPLVVSRPEIQSWAFVGYWSATAAIALGIIGIQVLHTARRAHSLQDNATTRAVLMAVAPAIAAGAAVTVILAARGETPLLPGLWPIFIALSVFAARAHFPKGSGSLALAYALAGIAILGFVPREDALRPAVMGLTFGIGQLGAAAVFHWNLERPREAAEDEA